MKILLVVADLGLGGAQQIVVHLANGLVNVKNEVYVLDVYPYLRKREITSQLNEKVNLISPRLTFFSKLYLKVCDPLFKALNINKRLNYSWQEKQQTKQLKSLDKERQVDVINSHVWWADKLVYDVLGKPCAKWVLTMHGSYRYCLSHPQEFPSFKDAAENVLATADGCIYISEQNKDLLDNFESFKKLPSKKIWNGIPKPISTYFTRKELNLPESAFIIFCASRAIKEKGWEELCEAFIQTNIPNGYLLFAGEGPDLAYFKEKYADLPIIQFLGFTNQVSQYIYISDICALPTYYQGEELPTFIIEAMAQGKPILGTDLGEIREMITLEEKIGGKIIPLHNGKSNISDIKNSLTEMAQDQHLLEKCADISFQRSTYFELKEMVKNYIQFFNNLN
ncbi:glycosyltransferase family 4 protein [Flammeovirgaceae bacterium SG7u.111]|nr:glycosyltransferase family 4 protein [Flammeovirgaceae bacterium SG7u.132]WPO34975.1 glycosyltransferase family 4 protein [Flammeovirgaceae bacterium SG7u.111]